jgi:uncharacterized protein YggE
MSRSGIAVVAVVAILALAPLAAPARAQFYVGSSAAGEDIEGFTVVGKGSASAKPDRLEIELDVSSASELTADAIVKYRDAKKRLQEAFRDLKLDNVGVEERGLLVDQKGAMVNPYYFDGQPNQRSKTEVQLSRKLVVTCSKVREMDEDALLQMVAKLLDAAQDAGGKVGPQSQFNPYYYNSYDRLNTSLVRYVLEDFDAVQEQAYEAAIADAKARAQRLAKLSGVELGPIAAVRELVTPGQQDPNRYQGPGMGDEPPRKRLESQKYQEIPVRVELLVRFEIRPAPKGDVQPAEGK